MSVPESTHEIASRVVEDAGGFDSNESVESAPAESAGGESTQETADTSAAAATSEQPRSGDQDELLAELGLKPREDGREHRIPYSRVQKIRENAIRKATEAAATDWQKKVADASRASAEIEQGLQRAVMEQPEQFLRELATVNPAIARFLAFEQQKQAQAGAGGPGEMPQPDMPLPDGSRTYSLKGIQQLLEWHASHVEHKVAERYKPVEQTVEQFRESQRRQALVAQSEKRVEVLYADASTWPGFKEHEGEINKAFNEDFKDLSTVDALNAAYRKVVISKLIAGKNQTRQEVIADLKGRPRSTALSGSAGAATETHRERDTTSIARDVLRRLSAAQ